MHALSITAAAALSPYGIRTEDFSRGYAQGPQEFKEKPELGIYFKNAPPMFAAMVPDYDTKKLLNTRSISSMDRLIRHTSVAMESLHEAMGFQDLAIRRNYFDDERISIILGTSGSIQSTIEFDLQTVRNPQFVQPGLFPNCVHAIPASHCAIRRKIKGSCITVTNEEVSVVDAFTLAQRQIHRGQIDLVILGGAAEATPGYAAFVRGRCLSKNRNMPSLSEGAYLIAVQSLERARQLGTKALGQILGATSLFCPSLQDGLKVCLDRLQDQIGRTLSSTPWLVSDSEVQGLDPRLSGKKQFSLEDRLGYLGATYAAAGILTVLSDSRIALGQEVLLVCVSLEGACGVILMKKEGELTPE